MNIALVVVLAAGAFWLGACPFSLWVGNCLAGKDIRNYGDGNPGAFNVFRATNARLGILALILDVIKGFPVVAASHLIFQLSLPYVLLIGICAILGHAYSPLLSYKGGKALAVTLGVLLALPDYEILIAMIILVMVGFLLMDSDAWAVMVAPSGTMLYLLATRGTSWEVLFVFSILVIWALKQFEELRTFPRVRFKPVGWLRAK